MQLAVPPSLEPLHRIGRDKAEAGRAANGRGEPRTMTIHLGVHGREG